MKKSLSSPPSKFAISSTGIIFFMTAILMVMQCTIVTAQKKAAKTTLTAANDADNPALFINQNGNVGVGTTDAHYKLQINGDLHMDGNTIYFHKGWWDKSAFINWNLKDDFNKVDDDKLALAGFGGVKLGDMSRYNIFFPIIRAGFSTKRAVVDIMTALRTDSANHPNGQLSMYVTGDMNEVGHGVEFRNNDGLEGIGFTKRMIYGVGANQSLDFKTAGTGDLNFRAGGQVKVWNKLDVADNLVLHARLHWNWPERGIWEVTGIGKGAYYINFGNSDNRSGNDDGGFRFVGYNQPVADMRIRDGFVGIGTDEPKFPLHVKAKKGGDKSNGIAGYELNSSGTGSPGYRYFSEVSIVAEGHIVSQGAIIAASNNNYSDIRLKKNITPTSSGADLEKLKRIAVMNYKMIDTVSDNKRYKKVIAQQLQKVYPDAVNVSFSTLPDIYQHALSVVQQEDSLYNICIAKSSNVKQGDVIALKCAKDGDVNVVVTAVNNNRNFTVRSSTILTGQKDVFVYGHPATDVLTVDYDAISMLNVSATQQLAKTIDEQQREIALLKAQNAAIVLENNKLKNEQAETKATVAGIFARLAKIEGQGAAKSTIAQVNNVIYHQ
jgi:hypothetical protein